MQNVYCCLIIFYLFIPVCLSWDADDLALFDVVEDVNKNFYELLELKEVRDFAYILVICITKFIIENQTYKI